MNTPRSTASKARLPRGGEGGGSGTKQGSAMAGTPEKGCTRLCRGLAALCLPTLRVRTMALCGEGGGSGTKQGSAMAGTPEKGCTRLCRGLAALCLPTFRVRTMALCGEGGGSGTKQGSAMAGTPVKGCTRLCRGLAALCLPTLRVRTMALCGEGGGVESIRIELGRPSTARTQNPVHRKRRPEGRRFLQSAVAYQAAASNPIRLP